ncbi:MAG: transposase [Thioploca sp.]|nr:transposase [Thioploca sp.]
MLNEMPKDCDSGCQNNSTGHPETWRGYKLHIATADGDIPVAALLSSAAMHDSGAILPLMKIAPPRVTSLYDLADRAYGSTISRDESRQAGHVPLIEHHRRNGEKIEFAPHDAPR